MSRLELNERQAIVTSLEPAGRSRQPGGPLHLIGRTQDVALKRIRNSTNERVHLRHWLAQLRFLGRPLRQWRTKVDHWRSTFA